VVVGICLVAKANYQSVGGWMVGIGGLCLIGGAVWIARRLWNRI